MSVITAVQPHAIINDSDHVYSRAPGVDNRRPDRAHRRDATAVRRSCAWEDQFAEVVHTRLPRLQRLARRILHGEDLADDAVQEALFSLWKEGRMPPNLEGWLVRAVVLRSLHLNRARRRRRGYEERAGAQRPESDPAPMPRGRSKPRKSRMRLRRCSGSCPNISAPCSCSARPSSATTSQSPRRWACRWAQSVAAPSRPRGAEGRPPRLACA